MKCEDRALCHNKYSNVKGYKSKNTKTIRDPKSWKLIQTQYKSYKWAKKKGGLSRLKDKPCPYESYFN